MKVHQSIDNVQQEVKQFHRHCVAITAYEFEFYA